MPSSEPARDCSPSTATTSTSSGSPACPSRQSTHDPRDGTTYAALDHGHFGVKVHRSDDGGGDVHRTGAAGLSRPTRRRVRHRSGARRRGAVDDVDAVDVRAGPSRRAGRAVGRHDPRRTLPLGRPWRRRGSSSDRCGTTRPGPSGSVAATTTPASTRSRSTRVRRRTIIVGISCGGAWRTTDGGSTWSLAAKGMRAGYMPPEVADNPAIQDPHRLAACREEPDVVWCQHHSGIFRSTDRGSSWTEITDAGPSTFGFAVAAHPTDPETAWFVPATSDEVRIPVDGHMVVTRTRDGGRVFEVLDTGLPDRAHLSPRVPPRLRRRRARRAAAVSDRPRVVCGRATTTATRSANSSPASRSTASRSRSHHGGGLFARP